MGDIGLAPPDGALIADKAESNDKGEGAPAGPRPAVTAAATAEADVMLRVTLALFAIGFGVWVVLAGGAYRRQYSGAGVAWHRGAHNFIEITVVPEDQTNLACAADTVMKGLHCSFAADRRRHELWSPGGDDDARVLSPYVTVNGELFLGAGLWASLARQGPLPTQRFTVFCDYDIVGALRSVALRWTPTGSFDPSSKSLAVGALRDCAIPP
jgi:hypothetical protein